MHFIIKISETSKNFPTVTCLKALTKLKCHDSCNYCLFLWCDEIIQPGLLKNVSSLGKAFHVYLTTSVFCAS